MNFELACNWDLGLIKGIKGYSPIELFGGMPNTVVAGGRASFVAPEVTEAQVERYIKDAHADGHTFNFLLNASCLDNREYRRDEYAKILEHIAWVEKAGADSVTVTIPFLLQMIKKHFPKLKVYVSSWARVENVRRAQFFEDMGADGFGGDKPRLQDAGVHQKSRKVPPHSHSKPRLPVRLPPFVLPRKRHDARLAGRA